MFEFLNEFFSTQHSQLISCLKLKFFQGPGTSQFGSNLPFFACHGACWVWKYFHCANLKKKILKVKFKFYNEKKLREENSKLAITKGIGHLLLILVQKKPISCINKDKTIKFE